MPATYQWWKNKKPNRLRATWLADLVERITAEESSPSFLEMIAETAITDPDDAAPLIQAPTPPSWQRRILTGMGTPVLLPFLPYVLSRFIANRLFPLPPMKNHEPLAESFTGWFLRRFFRVALFSIGILLNIALITGAFLLMKNGGSSLLSNLTTAKTMGGQFADFLGLALGTGGGIAIASAAVAIPLLLVLGIAKKRFNKHQINFKANELARKETEQRNYSAPIFEKRLKDIKIALEAGQAETAIHEGAPLLSSNNPSEIEKLKNAVLERVKALSVAQGGLKSTRSAPELSHAIPPGPKTPRPQSMG